MIEIRQDLKPTDLNDAFARFWELSGAKIRDLESGWADDDGSPVITIDGRWASQAWTEWTQGFRFGSAVLQFEATGDEDFLEIGRRGTIERMGGHVSHMGVHDHGFHNVSTYGNLRRLMLEGRIPYDAWELRFYELALKASGAVQARRWTTIRDDAADQERGRRGYIHSFNGPHSLFADTIRSLRVLVLAHRLGHALHEERDRRVDLLHRAIEHARTTAEWNVYYGEGRDAWDLRGRVAHESIFNLTDGCYRCPNSQQGYSPFTTWTRGLAWVMTGFAEQLEFLTSVEDDALAGAGGREEVEAMMLRAAEASCDFYLEHTPTDGIPYWDTGAPGLAEMPGWADRPAEPDNEHEPVDSSAAAIAAQGLLRLGRHLALRQKAEAGKRYFQAGLTVLARLLEAPYLCEDDRHQGLIAHAVYHRPNAWDHVPEGSKIPQGEACMWGDYHVREAVLYAQRLAQGEAPPRFFGPTD